MSQQITLAEARERLYAQLWPDEAPLDGDQRFAVAEHRLWQALKEQRFHAWVEGNGRLGPDGMTDAARREAFTGGPALVIADLRKFDAWLASVSPLTAAPNVPYMTAVEAAASFAYGAFLTDDDMWAITAVVIETTGKVEVVGTPENTAWQLAGQRLFGAHVDEALTLLGRQAPRFGADPVGDIVAIPRTFFAGDVALGVFNGIYHRRDASRVMYYEIRVSTTEFNRVFATPIGPAATGRLVIGTRRRPRTQDAHEFVAWAEGLHSNRGFGPSLKEVAAFAREHNLSREWARARHQALRPELRRERGGKGSATYQAKTRIFEQP